MNALSKRTQMNGFHKRGRQSTSTNDGKHPYLRLDFWQNDANKFWRSPNYSEASKEILAAGAGVTV